MYIGHGAHLENTEIMCKYCAITQGGTVNSLIIKGNTILL